MAFMMPVVKNDYDIYASRSRRSSSSASIPRSRRSTRCESAAPSLSCSPGSDVDERLAAAGVLSHSNRTRSSTVTQPILPGEARSRSGSQFASSNSCPEEAPKSASRTSLHRFHSRLVDKLKKTLGMKDDSSSSSNNNSEAGVIITSGESSS